MSAYIIGSGAYLPERVVTNKELAGKLGLDSERIFKSSGIRCRRWADSKTTTSALAARALRLALDDAQVTTAEIDYLLLGTMTPDRFIPGSASGVQKILELNEIPCLDIRAGCCNTLYALQIAKAIKKHKGKVTAFVPHYAMSGGTLISLAADEIVMSEHAVLGPVDPQVGKFPAASILRAAKVVTI